jgi:predicted phosphodiesterase
MLLFASSDFHFDQHRDGGRSFLESLQVSGSADVLVLAGDLCSLPHGLEAAVRLVCSYFKEVVYVAGNHEFWGTSKEKVFALLESLDASIPNFHWLENKVFVLEDPWGTDESLRFVGCTLWFEDQPDNVLFESKMGDFFRIEDFRNWVYQRNAESLKFLSENLQEGDIVVTHHLPTSSSLDPRYRDSMLNRFYVSNSAEQIIGENRPKLWVHGHTHHALDYLAGDTRILCNPFGNTWEDTGFREHLLIDFP